MTRLRLFVASLAGMVLAGLMVVPVAAGEYCIAGDYCQPKTATLHVNGKADVCGDPRLGEKFVNKGDVPALVRTSAKHGAKWRNDRWYASRLLQPGDSVVIWPRWSRGLVIAQVLVAGEWVDLYRFKIGEDVTPHRWGEGPCGPDRFSRPDFSDPDVFGRVIAEVPILPT
jgi:hypothetical protein